MKEHIKNVNNGWRTRVNVSLEVQQSTLLAARFKDFCFAAKMPRVFTTNAPNPHEFHSGLPHGPWSSSNAARQRLAPNIKAAFKRAYFAHVAQPMVPRSAQESHHKARRVGEVAVDG